MFKVIVNLYYLADLILFGLFKNKLLIILYITVIKP